MNTIGWITYETSCLVILIQKTQLHPARIFKAAFDYKEMRFSPKVMHDFYQECIADGVIPIFVEDYALDCLAGRAEWKHLKCRLLGGKK